MEPGVAVRCQPENDLEASFPAGFNFSVITLFTAS
jgi:hypothetical protein